MAFDIVQSILARSGAPFHLHHHVPVTTVEDARLKVPHLTVNLIKTVAFKIKDSHWILAGVNGEDRIHYKYLADAFGVNRKLIRPVSPADVESGLGFEIGGVGPFPVREDVKVILEESLMGMDSVLCGSGRNTVTVEMAPEDLARTAGALVAAIRKG